MKRYLGLFLVLVFTLTNNKLTAAESLDTLLWKLTNTDNHGEKLNIYWKIYRETFEGDPNLCYTYAQKFNALANKQGKAIDKARSFWALAWSNKKLGNLDTACENYLKSIHWYETAGVIELVGDGLKNIGNIFRQIDEYDKAYEFYFEALAIFSDLKIDTKIINAYRSISLCKIKEKKYREAAKYARRALIKSIKIQNEDLLNVTYNLLGWIYYEQGNYLEARINYFRSIKNVHLLDNIGINALGYAYNNIGETYREEGNFEKAYEYFNKALKIKSDWVDKNSIGFTWLNLGKLSLMQKNADSAITFLERSLIHFNGSAINDYRQEASSLLIEAYERKENPSEKDYKRLLELNRNYISHIHEVNTVNHQKLLSLIVTNDEINEEAQYLQQKTKRIQSKSLWIMAAAVVAVLGLLILLYYREKRFKDFIQGMWEDIKDI